MNVTGLPLSPADVAVKVFAPATAPSVHDVTDAIPPTSVNTAVVGSTTPPPLATANVTDTPDTGSPSWSETRTLGAVDTAVFTVADWPSPASIDSCSATPVAVNVTGLPLSPAGAACRWDLGASPALGMSVRAPGAVDQPVEQTLLRRIPIGSFLGVPLDG